MQNFRFTKNPVSQKNVLKAVDILVSEISGLENILAIYLFGSVVENKQCDQSDIDLLVVTADCQTIRASQKSLRHIQTLTDFPVDLVWIDKERFDRKKDLGGVCMVAYHDGWCVYSREQKVEDD